MELKDFTEKEQKQIEKGLSTAEISDKEAAKKLLALVPQEWIKRIPFFVRGHATTKTVERVAKQYPELYAAAKRQGDLPEKEREELRKISRYLVCTVCPLCYIYSRASYPMVFPRQE